MPQRYDGSVSSLRTAVSLGHVRGLKPHDITAYDYYTMPYDDLTQSEIGRYLGRTFVNGPVPRAPAGDCIITMQLERHRQYYLVTPESAIVIQLIDGQYRSTGILMTWTNREITVDDTNCDRRFAEVLYKLLFVYCEMIAEDPCRYKNVHSDHGVDVAQ